MRSDNVLWLGMLLFLLLVTSCVVHFIDNYNPHIQRVVHVQNNSSTQSVDDPFSKDVQIDTFIGDELQKGLESLTIPKSNNTSEVNITENISISDIVQSSVKIDKKEQQNIKIPNKIDKNIIPKKEKISKKPIYRKKIVQNRQNSKKNQKIFIQPVIITKDFYLRRDKKLIGDERAFLKSIAKRVLNDNSLFIQINTGYITPLKREYLQQISRYLRKNGLKTSQFEIITEKTKNKQNIVEPDSKNDFIELLLIERI